MAFDRRTFIRASMAAGLAGAAVKCTPASSNRKADAGRSIQFNFTGLIAVELFAAGKRMVASLVDAAAAHVMTPHAAMLMMRLSDYVFPEEFGSPGGGPMPTGLPYQRPQIIRIGADVIGLWGLRRCDLWVGGAQKTFDDVDVNSSFDFPAKGGDIKVTPAATDEAWSGREWFATARETAAFAGVGNAEPLEMKRDIVTARVSLTRGMASGVMPFTDCERKRKYSLVYPPPPEKAIAGSPSRVYAAELKVAYAVDGDFTDLRIVAESGMPSGATIRVRTPPGARPTMTIANSPLGRYNTSHFEAYTELFKFPKTIGLAFTDTCLPQTRVPSQTPASNRSDGPDEAHNPPDPGCLIVTCERP